MGLSLSPTIYSDQEEIAKDLKHCGWKVRPQKSQYKRNEIFISLSKQDPLLWTMTCYLENGVKNWSLTPTQVKQSLDHYMCVDFKNKKLSTSRSKTPKRRPIEKSLVKMGKVFFPLGFWLDFSQAKNVHNLLEKLFELPVFLSNAYLLLCVLKKGESFATVYDYSRGRDLKKINLESEKFNAIYDHVRKNKKGYLFNMSNLSAYLNVQGYALGGSATSSEYQVVFLVSKNELIPPAAEEIHAIKSLLPELIPWIEYVLDVETKHYKAAMCQSLAKLLPIALDFQYEVNDVVKKWSGELEEVSEVINEMEPQKIANITLATKSNSDETYLDLNHYQRVKLLGELFNTLKHELSNPLFGLKLSQQIILTEIVDQQLIQLWKNIEINVSRCEQILNSTLDLFGTKNIHQTFDLADVIAQALLLTKSKTKGILIDKKLADPPRLVGDPSLILHIVFNLLINAGEHLVNRKNDDNSFVGKINMVGNWDSEHECYQLMVADNGSGVAKEIQEKIFQKFVTSKTQGTGLGLSLSHKLAQKIPGELIFAGNGLILSGAHFILRIKSAQ